MFLAFKSNARFLLNYRYTFNRRCPLGRPHCYVKRIFSLMSLLRIIFCSFFFLLTLSRKFCEDQTGSCVTRKNKSEVMLRAKWLTVQKLKFPDFGKRRLCHKKKRKTFRNLRRDSPLDRLTSKATSKESCPILSSRFHRKKGSYESLYSSNGEFLLTNWQVELSIGKVHLIRGT